VEREILHDTTLELSYVGNRGVGLPVVYDANVVPAADRLDFIHAGSDEDARAALRPYGVFGNVTLGTRVHAGSSIYHALQTQLVSRFGHGSQFQASYTFSRTIGDAQGSEDGCCQGDLALERGLMPTHRKHIFNASLVLALPALADKSGFVKNVLGDWEVGTIALAASGSPLTITNGRIPGLTNNTSGTPSTLNRPNVVPGQACQASGGLPEQILNPNAWTLTGFQLGTVGNSGRGVCEGPNFFQVDLSLYKNIKISGRVKAQLRFEVFNVFNRANFTGVSTSLRPIFATLDTGSQRTATTITDFQPAGDFGQAGSTRDARQAQFGIKLTF
jgi:hypothetical protein